MAGNGRFLITIDTEGDNLWAKPREITTRNSRFLGRFQTLCERYGFKPVYLTNFEMASCPVFVEFGRDVLARSAGEIGMHLHAWNSPPVAPLTQDDYSYQPYLIEYSEPLMREKINRLTRLLEDTFSARMTSHRAGRWAFNEVYARMLREAGYTADCSVTPGVSWAGQKGDPNGSGGSDYRHFPADAYTVAPDDISRAGDSTLLEVPMTVISFLPAPLRGIERQGLAGRILNRFYPLQWLRPNGHNLEPMIRLVRSAAAEQRPYVEFMLHSSEFMPGGSPNFPSEADIERLYEHMERLFEEASSHFEGATLAEFTQRTLESATVRRR
jgi:hypothetical protein